MIILATDTELATLASLNDVVTFTRLNDGVWQQSYGFTAPDSILGVVQGLQLPVLDATGRARLYETGQPLTRTLSTAESVQFALVWRVCNGVQTDLWIAMCLLRFLHRRLLRPHLQ